MSSTRRGFFDGEFFGYADFVEHTADGWLVSDAKLARSAKPNCAPAARCVRRSGRAPRPAQRLASADCRVGPALEKGQHGRVLIFIERITAEDPRTLPPLEGSIFDE
jgi:hypothetical protein